MNNIKNQQKFNKIETSDYTLLTFLPMNLFNQFCRVANCYFLIISIAAYFLVDCPISPIATMVPLIVVVALAIIKQIPEFYFRRKSDELFNRKMVTVIRQGRPLNLESQYIAPGDLIVLKDKTDVPCDMVLLYTTNENRKCFVTTANLDGETNLRTLHLPPGLPKCSINDLHNLGIIECEAPTTDFFSFKGKFETINQVVALTANNLLLRGARIENTECIVGSAVYLGMQTKLQLNNGRNAHKTSTSERYINTYVSGFIVFMLIFVTLLCFLQRYDEIAIVPQMPYLGPPIDVNSASVIFNDFFSFLILFSYMIPLPLYVIIEVYRILGACFMRWDLKLYDESTNQSCVARTSDLNEELGQINVLFTDKTGTLTKNEMTLQQCSINGRKYNFKGVHLEATDNGEIYNFNQFGLEKRHFFEALALCHTIDIADNVTESITQSLSDLSSNDIILDIPSISSAAFSTMENLNFTLNYQATSPDELALVKACAELGLQYLSADNDILTLREHKSETRNIDLHYQRLHILEFTPERKRMSVIVKDQEERKWIYTKGADSCVFPLCENDEFGKLAQCNAHLSEFGFEGLRTLVFAYKQISDEEYAEFLHLESSATSAINQREELKEKCYAAVERDLHLLGATAVEDALQDEVASTLVSLRLAGIKVWMLTGDKVETALSTALLCGHIMPDYARHTIMGCLEKRDILEQLNIVQQFINEGSKIALIVDSQSLDVILTEIPAEFRNIAIKCSSVLCCRVNPLQKSRIVHLIKNSVERFITAAIGDGANDVAMLQEANIGIAVRSIGGCQAICGSDYAIAKFSMLKRLLLVHGHYNTTRLSLLVIYYFYQNVLISSAMLLFQFYAMYSGASLYDTIFLIMYTALYNILPAMIISFTEKPYSEETLFKFPELYSRVGRLSWPVFLLWTVDGFMHSVQVFLSAYFLFSKNNVILNDGQTAGLDCFGTLIVQNVAIISNLKLLLETKYTSYCFIISLAFSLLMFMLSTLIDCIDNNNNDPGIFWTYNEVLSSLTAWLFTILVPISCLLADFGMRYLRESFKLPKTWSFAQSGFVRTLQDYNILSSDELKEN